MLRYLTSAALAASLVKGSALPKRQDSDTLNWRSCPDAPSPWECALFQVPLDYANPSAGNTEIAVIRYPATAAPRRGSMFMNPGGPGVSGVEWLSSGGPSFQAQVGEEWDVLSFDPRGVGYSGPELVQFRTTSEEARFWDTVMNPGQYESHGNLTQSDDVEFFMGTASTMDERLQALNDLFVERNGDNLKYLGSAAVVRDLVGMVDAIDGSDADVNFYGYSYGTLLAMELTQMFPDRIGRVLIDGVVDPSDWSEYPPYLGWDLDIADAEAGYKGYTEACARAGRAGCPLISSSSDTAETVDRLINTILNSVYDQWDDIRNYSHNELLEVIFGQLYSPSSWEQLGSFLAQFLTRSTASRKSTNIRRPLSILHGGLRGGRMMRSLPITGQSSSSLIHRSVGNVPLPNGSVIRNSTFGNNDVLGGERGAYRMNDYSIVAIFCGDAVDSNGATTEDVFREIVRVSQTVSYKFGSQFNSRFFCHKWTSRAVERYTGPWNVQPKNTVLVIGNEADPITPYRSAKLIASGDYLGGGARLVLQQNFGHTSGAMTSECTDNVIREYVNGTPPDDSGNDDADVVCPTNFSILGLSPDIHWEPATSEHGDDLTSGPDDPGLDNTSGGNPDNNNNSPGSGALGQMVNPFGSMLIGACTLLTASTVL